MSASRLETATSVPLRPKARAFRWQSFVTNRLLDITLLILVIIMVAPIIFLVIGSFKSTQEFASGSGFWPKTWQWRNYVTMWERADFAKYLGNSVMICVITTIIVTFFASLTGYALARFKFPGSTAFGLAIIGTQMIPGTLFLIPLYMTFLWLKNKWGLPLIGTNMGAIILYVGFFLPVALWIQRGFFAAIPPDLEEQAMVDGATRFQAFWYIVLPLASPGVISTAIFVFLTAWDELLFAWVLNVQTIPVGIRQFTGVAGAQNRYELLSAASVVIILPVAAMFFLLQRRFVAGLTAGAVK